MVKKSAHRVDRRQRIKPKIRLSGDPVLSKKCDPVECGPDGFTDPAQVANILLNMMSILINSKTGIGLAANQAGYLSRIIIIRYYDVWLKMINPEIIDIATDKNYGVERCLSYPGKSRNISRFNWVQVKYLDENGESQEMMLGKDHARTYQHEDDHMGGACQVGIVDFDSFKSRK